jgi:hypothetical protein
MMMIITITSVRWDYVSELRPQTCLLLFIFKVIHELGEPWWHDINNGKLLIGPLELSHYYHQSRTGKENYEFGILNIFVHTSKWSFTCRLILRCGGQQLYFRSEGRRNEIFLPKAITSAGFQPSNLESNDKHANHYTTEATKWTIANGIVKGDRKSLPFLSQSIRLVASVYHVLHRIIGVLAWLLLTQVHYAGSRMSVFLVILSDYAY